MAPKKKKPEVETTDQVLQGVVVAEGFDGAFRPLGAPRCLVELCGWPLLEYTLRFLARSGVEEVFVLSAAHHSAAIAAYVEGRRGAPDFVKTRRGAPVSVICLGMAGCASTGDLLRELDQRGLVKSDPFLMVGGDVVAHVADVDAIMRAHVDRKKNKDPDATLTILMAEAGDRRRRLTPLGDDDLVVCVDDATKRVIAWAPGDDESAYVKLPADALVKAQCARIRSDLVDCHVDVCSPEVLWRYSENFDYQDARRDFVRNETTNVELGQRVYVEVLGDGAGFGARVADPRALDFVARDLIGGWFAPTLRPRGVEKGRACVLARGAPKPPRSARLRAPLCLGAGVALGDGCEIAESTVGAGSTVGARAAIRGAHVGARCAVGAGATITQALLGPDVTVADGAVVPRGCVLGEGVVVAADAALKPFDRVTARKTKGRGGADSDAALVGAAGVGRAWRPDERDDDDDDAAFSGSDDESEATDVGADADAANALVALGSIGNVEAAAAREKKWWAWPAGDAKLEDTARGDDAAANYDDDDDDDDFGGAGVAFDAATAASDAAFAETVKEMVASGHRTGAAVDSMLMEINCYKLSENRSFRDAAPAALEAVLDLCFVDGASAAAVAAHLKTQIPKWTPLLAKLLGSGDVADEVFALDALENVANGADPPHPRAKLATPDLFAVTLQLLYGADVLSGEGIAAWGAKPDACAPLRASPQITQLLAWLESDDDDESGDESGETESQSD